MPQKESIEEESHKTESEVALFIRLSLGTATCSFFWRLEARTGLGVLMKRPVCKKKLGTRNGERRCGIRKL